MLGFLLVSLLMHPVHETVSEIEWNPETRPPGGRAPA